MSFDTSRYTFDPWNNFAGVVMPQGRVQLDSDWNEWLAELGRRLRAGTLDIVGRAAVPITTKNGFKIELAQSSTGGISVSIGQGRMYVDGLLAENHGLPAPDPQKWIPSSNTTGEFVYEFPGWDSALDEFVGAGTVNYNQQPYFPGADTFAPFPQSGGPYLIFLDVWQREVTFLEHPDLIEKAVGVDTAGRLQTVWQVKWLDVSNVPGINCTTHDSQIPSWANLLLPSGARLSTGIVQSSSTGPCCLNPNNGYTGLENQQYRIEIHQKGPAGTATFKWSRDNASVATSVTAIQQGGKVLTVQSVGKDDVLRFSANDWVEITDDWLELHGLPGELRQIASVSDQTKTITLSTPVSLANFPVNATGETSPGRNTRLTRWDQAGKIYESDGSTVWADLDALGSGGDIPVPPQGTTLILENGITVSFDATSNATSFRTGDFWTFAARATDGTIEYLDQAPPRGIYHHYARLAVVGLSSVPLSGSGTILLPDRSQPPIDFLAFRSTPVEGWPPNFRVIAQANAVNSSHLDLEVVYDPSTLPSNQPTPVVNQVQPPVPVESFTNLSLNSKDPNYAPTVINLQSQLVTVPPYYQPPPQPPIFSSGPSTARLSSTTAIQLHDASQSPFLTLQTTSLANWPQKIAVAATPSGSGNLSLEVSYAPPGKAVFATLERFENLSLLNVGLGVQSQFIMDLTPIGSPPPAVSALSLVALDDCRTFWPLTMASSGSCECPILVNPSDFDDSNTLQHFLDQYQNRSTETVVCFSPGIYSLKTPLRLTTANSNLTLRACQKGTVVLQAEAGKENQFSDGLIVLADTKHVTLEGLTFLMPLVPFTAINNQFAGLPIGSFGPYVQSQLNNLTVSIGLRPTSCSSLAIENCLFEFSNSRWIYAGRRFASSDIFGAGIFAAGQCDGLSLVGNSFQGGIWFGVGFLQSPAVAFAPSSSTLPIRFAVARTSFQASQPAEPALTRTPAPAGLPTSTSGVLTGTNLAPSDSFSAAGGGEVLPVLLTRATIRDNSFTGLAAAALIFGEGGTIEFTRNQVENSIRGFWVVSPAEAEQLWSDPAPNSILLGGSVALGYPLPQNVAATALAIAPAKAPVRVYTGAQPYTNSLGITWVPDKGIANGGNLYQPATPNPIPGTDPALYQNERHGPSFSYTFTNLSTGFYTVTLKFAEIDGLITGQRIFNVLVNNIQVLTNFDIFGDVHAANTPDDKVFSNIAAVNNQIVIQFVGSIGEAKVSAVERDPQWAFPVGVYPGGYGDPRTSEFWNLFRNLFLLGQQAFANLAVLPLQVRVAENEMRGLSSIAVLLLGDDQIQNGKVSSLTMSGNRLNSTSAGFTDGFSIFDSVVATTAVLRCTVSGNEILNTASRCSLCLANLANLKPGVVVMSNLFQGYTRILPFRSQTDPNVPAPLNNWDYLNTVIY